MVADKIELAEKSKKRTYRKDVSAFMTDISVIESMIAEINAYDKKYYPVCLGLYTVLQKMKGNADEITSRQSRETIRKIYDIYFQIKEISRTK